MRRLDIARKLINSFSLQTWVHRWGRFQGLRYEIADRVNANHGWFARRIRWPLGIGSPKDWPELHVLRAAGLGDCLMATPALRLLKQIRPRTRIVYYTPYVEAFRGLPFLDEVRSHEDFPHRSAWWTGYRIKERIVDHRNIRIGYRDRHVQLIYEGCIRPRRHIARIHGDQLGLDVEDVRPSCVFDEARIRECQEAWSHLPRPWVVVNRRAAHGGIPSKDWPNGHWAQLVARLLDRYTVVEIGYGMPGDDAPRHPHYVDLTGKMPLDRFLAAIAAADLHVGAMSGPVHVAAAAGKPAVIIFGGREHPDCECYPGNVNLYTELPCSGCWLPPRMPCPHDAICLSRITPEQVEEAVDALVRTLSTRSPGMSRTNAGV